MERCPDCKEQLYSILPNCSTDKYLLVCDKIVPVKRPASSTSLPCVPLFSSAALEAPANTGGGFIPVTPEDSGKKAPKMQIERMHKKPRITRSTFSKKTYAELFTAAEVEAKRKEIQKMVAQTKRAKLWALSQHAIKKKDESVPQKYQLYVEIEFTHKVRASYSLVDLEGKDSYLKDYTPQRRNAVIALCRAVSEGMFKTKQVSEEAREYAKVQTSRGHIWEKSVVDLISWAWLFERYAKPFINKWNKIVSDLAQSGNLQAERQAVFFKLMEKKMTTEASSPTNSELTCAAGSFEPILPEKSSFDLNMCHPLPVEENSMTSLFWMDELVTPLQKKYNDEVEAAHFAAFVPSYEACGFKRPKSVRFSSSKVTVTSPTTLIVDSPHAEQIKPGMCFFRYTRVYRVVSVESRTVTFTVEREGYMPESLHIGKMSDTYPNLNRKTIVFREALTNDENSDNVLAPFNFLRQNSLNSVLTDQVSRFLCA